MLHGVDSHVQYLQPARTTVGLPLYCLDVGSARTLPGHPYPPLPERHPRQYRTVAAAGRRLKEYQIVYIAEGTGWFEDEAGGRREVVPGSVLALAPGSWHRYAPSADTGWREYWIGFTGESVAPLWTRFGFPDHPVVALGPRDGEAVEALLSRGLRLSMRPALWQEVELSGIAQQILARIAGALASGGVDPVGDSRFERAREYLLGRVRDPVDTGGLAEVAGCSRSTLNRLFVQRTGLSPYRYFLSLRINATQWELAHTDRPLKDIAREYGFSDVYHFSRVFHEITGDRPGHWRSRARRRG